MAQVGIAWSLANDFVTAPIVGTTSLDNLKELIGESGWWHTYLYTLYSGVRGGVHTDEKREGTDVAEGVHVMLTPEEKKYLDEPYTPRAIVSRPGPKRAGRSEAE